MKLPPEVVGALSVPVQVGQPAQAFPFLTVADDGFPHCCLLSTTELAVAPDATAVHVALAARRTRAHLAARGTATLLVTEGTTLHSCRLTVTRSVDHQGLLAAALDVAAHHADSLGIALSPLGFVPPADLAVRERWDLTTAALRAITSC